MCGALSLIQFRVSPRLCRGTHPGLNLPRFRVHPVKQQPPTPRTRPGSIIAKGRAPTVVERQAAQHIESGLFTDNIAAPCDVRVKRDRALPPDNPCRCSRRKVIYSAPWAQPAGLQIAVRQYQGMECVWPPSISKRVTAGG